MISGFIRRLLRSEARSSPAALGDEELVSLASAGDENAFSELMRRYENTVYHTAAAVLGRSDDAADVSQETFIKVYRSLPSFRGECRFSTWIYRICVNCARDWLRRAARNSSLSLTASDDEERPDIDLPDGEADNDPEQSLEEKHRREAVWNAIGKLSEEHRVILVLRDMQGRSYEEISRLLNLAPGTVKSRLSRARDAVKRELVRGNFLD